MILSDDAKWLVENVVSWLIVFLVGAGVFVAFLRYLNTRTQADRERDSAILASQKNDNQQWVTVIGGFQHVMEGVKTSMDAHLMVTNELTKSIAEDRTRNMAYQNTSTTALAELLTILKEWRGVPADMKKANETLGIIQKGQVGLTEMEARRELEFKSELARMNNVMLSIQTAIAKLETAVGQLPMAVQKAVAPTFTPILTAIDELLVVAKDTQNKLVEKNLGEVISTPPIVTPLLDGVIPTPNPSPLNGEGNNATGGE